MQEEDDHIFKKLSATELEKVLPMDERTIRRHLKHMVKRELLLQHEEKPKLYRLGRRMGGACSSTQAQRTLERHDALLELAA